VQRDVRVLEGLDTQIPGAYLSDVDSAVKVCQIARACVLCCVV
jgi:hypothetical protein